MKKTIQIFILLAVVTAVILFSLFFFSAEAQSPLIFGGFVTRVRYCNCSLNFLVTISSPVGGQFIFRPGTPQYEFKRLPSPGIWTLGLYRPGGLCLEFSSHSCYSVGIPRGVITSTVGTSL